ncbi:putative FAD binding domain protein [Neofusicoccum parvum]|nr:putative FAD binding domain protein [Neofusicoccum parvum]
MDRISRALVLAACALGGVALADNSTDCKCIPGDACWPSTAEWSQLNQTVGGKLISNKPLAHVCHDPDYDEAACDVLKEEWVWPVVHQDNPTSMQEPYWQNCTPFTPQEQPCELGNDAVYSINVTSADDMAAGVQFAQKNNIRLVVRSTGHDFLGKSTGKGSLGLWTHNMKDIAVLTNYTSAHYTGPALRLSAGVRGTDALSAATAAGLVVLTGNCPTVGLTGGWTQGGGHSPLSTAVRGMGADQVLEWDVVTASGARVTATPSQHADLYWALAGGGPGAYGIAVSVTVRAFPDGAVGGATLAFANASSPAGAFWRGVQAWFAAAPGIVDAGGHAGFAVVNGTFALVPLTLAGADEARVREVMAPFTAALQNLSIPFSYNVTSLPSYYDHYAGYLGPIPRGNQPVNVLMGGRLIPRAVVEADGGAALAQTFRELQEQDAPGLILEGIVTATNASAAVAPNALLPQWRDSLISTLAGISWDFAAPREANLQREALLNDVVVPKLTALTPGSGTYLNEANFALRSWKEDFYGVNYDRLRAIKSVWDPNDLFYGPTMVGSDAWVEQDGRLCRA